MISPENNAQPEVFQRYLERTRWFSGKGRPSFGSVVAPAKPVHCSSAADRSASGAKPAVREVLESVCAARMKSGEASAGCAARHALHCASSTAMCSAASLV